MAPENGSIALPIAPGLGFTLDEAKIEHRKELDVLMEVERAGNALLSEPHTLPVPTFHNHHVSA